MVLVSAWPALAAGLHLDVAPATLARVTYDPERLPPEMPPLAPDEKAVTEAEFRIAVGVQVLSDGSKKLAGGRRWARVTVTAIDVETKLHTTIWLPPDASDSLTAHEEGHRQLSERVYAEAQEPFRAQAKPWLGRSLEGEGGDVEAARDAAISRLIEELSAAWLARTHRVVEEVGGTYDALTDHGRALMAPDDAIGQALAAWRRAHPEPSDP
jgi:hypothetical protein